MCVDIPFPPQLSQLDCLDPSNEVFDGILNTSFPLKESNLKFDSTRERLSVVDHRSTRFLTALENIRPHLKNRT